MPAIDGRPILSATAMQDALRLQSAGPQLTGMPDDGAGRVRNARAGERTTSLPRVLAA